MITIFDPWTERGAAQAATAAAIGHAEATRTNVRVELVEMRLVPGHIQQTLAVVEHMLTQQDKERKERVTKKEAEEAGRTTQETTQEAVK